jgi:ribulose-phosphate 3-epimerase
MAFVDLVLVMTVNPGWGGQTFIEEMIDKISRLRKILDSGGYKAELEVDGGINAENAPRVVKAGANILVAGAAVFNNHDSVEIALQKIRECIK